jgi:hypothetical protein
VLSSLPACIDHAISAGEAGGAIEAAVREGIDAARDEGLERLIRFAAGLASDERSGHPVSVSDAVRVHRVTIMTLLTTASSSTIRRTR